MAEEEKPEVDAGAEDDDERSALSTAASTIADAATASVAASVSAVSHIAGGARRLINERPGARVRRVRQMGKQPLANLWELHPEARSSTFRELAPRVVPVDLIAGTAVEGPVQRGGDFLPVRERRGADWRARWQRILNALDELAALPPVELVKFGDGYWVVDGHNRVAAALYNGQDEIDANVVEARMPGMPVRARSQRDRAIPRRRQPRVARGRPWPWPPSARPTITSSQTDSRRTTARMIRRLSLAIARGVRQRPHTGATGPLPGHLGRDSHRLSSSSATATTCGRSTRSLGCGDLEPDYLAFLADAFKAPLLYVRGNHDRGAGWSIGAEHIPDPLDGASSGSRA